MQTSTNDSGHVAGGKTEADTSLTATPWEVVDARICKDGYLLATCWAVIPVDVQQDGESWRDMQERIEPQRDASQSELLARAAFIVRACNAHQKLVSALQMAKHFIAAEGTTEQLYQVFEALELAGIQP